MGDPCVVCALYEIFMALSKASVDTHREAVAPTSLRVALSNLYPDSNFFQEVNFTAANFVKKHVSSLIIDQKSLFDHVMTTFRVR